jgi:hypothetical protein
MVSRALVIWTVLLPIVAAVGCAPERRQESGEVAPELTFESITFRVYRGGVMTAAGTADRASLRRDTSDVLASGVVVAFPPEAGRPEAHATAVAGAGNLRERRFTAPGGVRAEQAGQVAITDRAAYDPRDGLIRGDRAIRVDGGRFSLRGPAFTLDPRDQVLTVTNGASVIAGGDNR